MYVLSYCPGIKKSDTSLTGPKPGYCSFLEALGEIYTLTVLDSGGCLHPLARVPPTVLKACINQLLVESSTRRITLTSSSACSSTLKAPF